MNINRAIRSLWKIVQPTPIESRPEYQEAETFKRTIEPTQASESYEWVWDYSKDVYDRISKMNSVLDDKANDIVKYLGGGTGIFTVGLLSNMDNSNVSVFVWALPSYFFALFSIWLAILARKPNTAYSPPSVKSAFEYADDSDMEKPKASFIGQWHLACVGMRQSVAIKSIRVEAATWMFFCAIGLLILPVMFAVWKHWTVF
jgi:hypothetical protein